MRRPLVLIAALAALLIFASAGRATVIAVIDTGIAPIPELVPYIVPDGFDFVNNDPDASDDNGHGSVIAIIAVGTSQFTAQVLPVKAFDASGVAAMSWVRDGIDFSVARPDARILNLATRSLTFDVPVLTSLQNAAAAGKIIVMAAGNSGLPNPDFPGGIVNLLSGRAIAVGAVGPDNIIRPYSARAGSSMNFYLVAQDDFLNLGLLGTSFAAPQVSGAAALILHNAPFLGANEVVDILLRTAVDLGPPGTDPIYGHGLLNEAAALMPVGQAHIPIGDTVSDAGAAIEGLALQLGPAVASALLDNSRIENTLIVDAYKRPFVVNLAELATIHDSRPTLSSLMDDMRGLTQPMQVSLTRDHTLSMWVSQSMLAGYDTCFGFCDFDPSEVGTEIAMSLSGVSGTGLHYRLNLNTDLNTAFGPFAAYGMRTANLLSRRSLLSPYLSFAEQSDSMALGYVLGDRLDVTFGFVATDEGRTYGRRSDAALVEGIYKVSDRMSVKAQLGTLSEQGSLFGGSSDGAFAVDESNTTAVSLGAQVQLTPSIALAGHYTRGYTHVDDVQHSLFHDFSDLHSEAFGAALLANNVFRKDDRLALAVSRPLRVTSGSVDLQIPYARDYVGNVLHNTERVSLAPQGVETDLEVSYRFPLRKRTTLGTNLVYRDQPNHSQRFESDLGVYALIRHDF